MAIVDLTIDPASATSASAGSATDTHTTARIGCVTVNSSSTTAGTMGAKVGYDSGNEDMVLIFGKLPEKYDVFGSVDGAGLEDSAMKVVGMTMNLTTSSDIDTIRHCVVTEFDHKLDRTVASGNGYTKAEVERICWNGPDRATTSTATITLLRKTRT